MPRRFLFSMTSGYGHFHPLVPLAKALKAAGHRVAFATRPFLQARVESAGFALLPVGIELTEDPEYRVIRAQVDSMPMNLETELFSYPRLFAGPVTRLRTPELVRIAKFWKPDMLIREAAEYCALIAAEHLNLPHSTVAFAAALKGFSHFERDVATQLDPVRQAWGLSPDPKLTTLTRYLQLAYTPPSFAIQDVEMTLPGYTYGHIPPTTHFIRPEFFDQAESRGVPEWLLDYKATGLPLVYLTLGTEVNRDPDFYPVVLQTIISGLRAMRINLIVTLGRDKDPSDFGPQPPNVHIEPYIPQSLLLDHCDLIVMHGGSNTLLQAVDSNLPMVIVPLIADQFFNAQVAQRVNLGRVVEREELTPTSIRAAVEEVLSDRTFRDSTQRIRAEMHALPGQDFAIELIERVITTREPALNPDLIRYFSAK